MSAAAAASQQAAAACLGDGHRVVLDELGGHLGDEQVVRLDRCEGRMVLDDRRSVLDDLHRLVLDDVKRRRPAEERRRDLLDPGLGGGHPLEDRWSAGRR